MPGADDTLNAGGPAEHDILDDLCTCGHRLGDHHTIDEACLQDACACAAFQWTGGAFGHSEPTPEQIRARLDARDGGSMGTLDQSPEHAAAQATIDAIHTAHAEVAEEHPDEEFVDSRPHDAELIRRAVRPRATRNNTHEAADKTHADLAEEMDREPMSPTAGMTDEEREESDAVQAETLANLCTCGHPYGVHTVGDDHCIERDCVCLQFEALLKPVGLEFAHDENIGPAPEDIVDASGRRPYAVPEGADIIENAEAHRGSAIDHAALERDRRLPYTPPILRKRLIGEDELRKVLQDAGRLDLLAKLPEPEVDRVTTNYDAEHWSEIERLARFPQGSSETTVSRERTTKAIATALLELRQCLGVTNYTEQLVKHIEANAAVIHETAVLLDRITSRLPQTGEDT